MTQIAAFIILLVRIMFCSVYFYVEGQDTFIVEMGKFYCALGIIAAINHKFIQNEETELFLYIVSPEYWVATKIYQFFTK